MLFVFYSKDNLAELQKYPEIVLEWKEPGLAFRVIFIKKDYKMQQELQQELQQESLYSKVLRLLSDKSLSKKEISTSLGQKDISGHLNEVIKKLINNKLIERTIKDKPTSSKQKYLITKRGIAFVKHIDQSN